MTLVWLIFVGILALGVSIVAGVGFLQRRSDENIAKTADWLEAEATIQSAKVEIYSRGRYTVKLPTFAFSFSTNGEYFSGRFTLLKEPGGPDVPLVEMIGRKIGVNFDPNDPSSWVIPDVLFEGCRVQVISDADLPISGLEDLDIADIGKSR